MGVRVQIPPFALENNMDNTSGAYELRDRIIEVEDRLLERIRQLEYEVEQMKVTQEVLWQVIDKLRPKNTNLE